MTSRSSTLSMLLSLLLVLVAAPGCTDAAREEAATPIGDVAATDSGSDQVADGMTDPPEGGRPQDMGLRPETGLDLLYCGLTDDFLIAAGLRGAACIEGISLAGVLDDAARGFVHGDMLRDSYGRTTYGNCDYLVCLAAAPNCAAAQACEDARWLEPCEQGFGTRCDGDQLQACTWAADESRWLQVQDCTRIEGARCEEADGWASCRGPSQTDACGHYGDCQGDTMRRCTEPVGDARQMTEVLIDCGALVEGGTCIETPVGGEAPGPTCSIEARECTNSFAEGFGCDPQTGGLDVCLYGRTVAIRCMDFGYSGCTDEGFFEARCVE